MHFNYTFRDLRNKFIVISFHLHPIRNYHTNEINIRISIKPCGYLQIPAGNPHKCRALLIYTKLYCIVNSIVSFNLLLIVLALKQVVSTDLLRL